jgi:putative transposase
VTRLCQLAAVSRASYYRSCVPMVPEAGEIEWRGWLQEIALEFPAYGYRRITAELKRRGCAINHKRVLRLMRQDNLLCLRRPSFLTTTDSRHRLPIYPNLAGDSKPSAVNQLWVADITYIRLQRAFVYLAVLLDVYSRRVIGWALGRTLEAQLVISALQTALDTRQPEPGWIHHSDRGVQYASLIYTDLLRQHGAQISMSRRGNPYDNAFAESLMKTLKYEEVYRMEYRDLADATQSIRQFIEQVYNEKRLHSALCYHTPAEFEKIA